MARITANARRVSTVTITTAAVHTRRFLPSAALFSLAIAAACSGVSALGGGSCVRSTAATATNSMMFKSGSTIVVVVFVGCVCCVLR